MTNETAITTIDVRNTAIESYGNRAVVRELVSRLMNFHPAAADVGKSGMLAAAQIAILMGASPLPGLNEIHIWRDNKGKTVVQPGINYWRRRAGQLEGVLWEDQPRPMTDDERLTYGVAKEFLGAICKGIPMRKLRAIRELGVSIDKAYKGALVIGIGVAANTEYAKQGRPHIWTALKRAETDFYKQAYPYQPGENIAPGQGMTLTDDGSYHPDYGPSWEMLDVEAHDVVYDSDEIEDTDQLNYEWFDAPLPTNEPAPDPRAETSPQAQATRERPTADTVGPPSDMHSWLEEHTTQSEGNGLVIPWGHVADALVMTGKYKDRQHVKNAVKKEKSFDIDFRMNAPFVKAVAMYDWAIARKEGTDGD